MRKVEVDISKEELSSLVLDKRLSLKDVYEHFGCSRSTIQLRCREFGINFPKRYDENVDDVRKRVYNSYKTTAERKGLAFELTEQQFYDIVQKPCKYCGRAGTNTWHREMFVGTAKSRKPFSFTGIDRRDATQGYTIENSDPCCKRCNYGKNDCSEEEFKEWIQALVNNNKHLICS